MNATLICLALAAVAAAEPLSPGKSTRSVQADDRQRSYQIYVPEKYDAKQPTPVVLALHGAWTNGPITEFYSGLDRTADEHNFIVVYPNGTGIRDTALFWNSGGREIGKQMGRTPPDDIAYLGKVLDDLATVANVDPKRIYATGISNGGMMCYRLAGEMSDRIAAIAPISGTLCQDEVKLKRPMPVLHFHGTDDKLVPYDGAKSSAQQLLHCKGVDDTIATFVKLDGCPEKPKAETLPNKADDGTTVEKFTYAPGKDGSEVILIKINGGGHNWPDRPVLGEMLGKSTHQINANETMWEFFARHPLK